MLDEHEQHFTILLKTQAMKILSKKKLKRKAGMFGRALPKRKTPGGADRKISESPLLKVRSCAPFTQSLSLSI